MDIKGMPFIGAEAISAGLLTRGQLRWNYTAMHPGVYLANGVEETLEVKAVGAWLRTGRRGVIAGRAASALHGAKWVDADIPIELVTDHTRTREGVVVWEERLAGDEIVSIGDLPVTSIARTLLDLARHRDRDDAVAGMDALAAATGPRSTTCFHSCSGIAVPAVFTRLASHWISWMAERSRRARRSCDYC